MAHCKYRKIKTSKVAHLMNKKGKKMMTNSFRNRNFMQPMRWLNIIQEGNGPIFG
jgi:hypothetical protein